MKLSDLVGLHELTGIETGVTTRDDNWRNEHANYIKFCLDGKIYKAVEDPSDGYRSYCDELEEEPHGDVKVKIPTTTVLCHMMPDEEEWPLRRRENDVLILTDVNTGKDVLRVGTENTGDYYPYCVMEWMPENLACNAERTEEKNNET